jgi:hypothetical protein
LSLLTRCRFRVLACAGLAGVVTLGAATPSAGKPSRSTPGLRLEIVRPHHAIASGTIFFSVGGVPRRARMVVFSVDHRTVDAVNRRAVRCPCVIAIDTKALPNGQHILGAQVLYPGRRSAAITKTIVVHNQATIPSALTGAAGMAVGAVVPPTHGVRGGPIVRFNRETYLYRTAWSTTQEADRYQFMVLSGNEYAQIPRLKAVNPHLKFLVYQAIMYTNSDDYKWMPTVTGCTAYADDIAHHPSWFLRDQHGNLILAPHRTDLYPMAVDNPGYLATCATNAAALAKRYGFDGIFWDTADGSLSNELHRAGVPAYPTRSSWQHAMGTALAYLGRAMNGRGLLAFANIANTSGPTMWEQWVSHLNGVEEEAWTDNGFGLERRVPPWSAEFTELRWAMVHGQYEFVHSYNRGETANRFGLASMLLATNGRASYSTTNGATTDEYWFPDYDSAAALGAPAGRFRVLSNGVYERPFAHGIVLVNPSTRSIPAFWLGGDQYSGSGTVKVRAVGMAPTSALILLKSG